MYCYFRNIFPPWSSQMTILLISNAMYHIRYTNGEYEFKRKNPHGLITAKHRLHQPTGKTPHYAGGNLVAFLMWNGICLDYVSKNTWAVANKTVDIQSTHHTINMSYRHSIIKTQRHSSKGTVITSSQEIPSNTSMHEY